MRLKLIVALYFFCILKIDCSPIKDLSGHIIDESQFKNQKLIKVFSTGDEGFKIAENYTGIAQSYFYAISPSNKSQTAEVYNKNIASEVLLIKNEIQSLSKDTHESAKFISKTLTQLTESVNQLIIDSSMNASKTVLHRDNIQIQNIVSFFKEQFPHTLGDNHKKNVCKVVTLANKSLQAFADNIELYTQEINALVFGSSSGNRKLVSTQTDLVKNLRKFVVASSLAAYLSTNEG